MTRMTFNQWRGEHGHFDSSFLRTVTVVCFATLVLSGLIVYWIGRVPAPPRAGDQPPTAHASQREGHKPPAGDTERVAQRPTPPPHVGGDACG